MGWLIRRELAYHILVLDFKREHYTKKSGREDKGVKVAWKLVDIRKKECAAVPKVKHGSVV